MKSRIRQREVKTWRPSTQRGALAVLATVAALSACTNTTEPIATVRIVAASQTVALQPSAQGPTLRTSVTLTNTSSVPIYWSSCGVSLEQKVDFILTTGGGGNWQMVWAPYCLLDLSLASTLQPGESVTVPIEVVVTRAFVPSFSGEPGLYRVHLSLNTQTLGKYVALPHEASSSDPFTLVAQ